MRAIGYQQPGSIDRENALTDIELPAPKLAGRDILVEVKAVSVNPVDTKVRNSAPPDVGSWKVLGWDAAGIVAATGPDATLFQPGDEVFYAGAIGRPGTNSEYHLVDERIVGNKSRTLDWAEAAALPLTAITAWEALFDRLDVRKPVPGAAPAIVIIGGAGGVGSVAIQLARALTELTVIATASRPETVAWVREMGAHHVVDHVVQGKSAFATGLAFVPMTGGFCCKRHGGLLEVELARQDSERHYGNGSERHLQGAALHVRGDPVGAALVSGVPDQLP